MLRTLELDLHLVASVAVPKRAKVDDVSILIKLLPMTVTVTLPIAILLLGNGIANVESKENTVLTDRLRETMEATMVR